jgi:hypothetical protein
MYKVKLLLYPRTKSGILWFWSRTPPPSPPPPETVWFPEATDHNFEWIVFIFGIHLLGVKVSPPIENGQGRVISPGVGGQKPPKLSTFSYFSLCGLKTFILFYMRRIIFVLHLNPYLVTLGHCPGGGAI